MKANIINKADSGTIRSAAYCLFLMYGSRSIPFLEGDDIYKG